MYTVENTMRSHQPTQELFEAYLARARGLPAGSPRSLLPPVPGAPSEPSSSGVAEEVPPAPHGPISDMLLSGYSPMTGLVTSEHCLWRLRKVMEGFSTGLEVPFCF